VKEGQAAEFTVDAYPDRRFPAEIKQVRYGSQIVDGVVTYETVLLVDNTDLLLRPGMTATADIVVQEIENALLVPNVALRFVPAEAEESAEAPSGGSVLSKLFPRPSRSAPKPKIVEDAKKQAKVWILRAGQLTPMDVTTGATDGIMTVITAGDVSPGMELVVDSRSIDRSVEK
jgi:HlyD family secretion protein